ncbi:MAG: alanine/glycine:cation symporter family protein [Myxococcota bacterium]
MRTPMGGDDAPSLDQQLDAWLAGPSEAFARAVFFEIQVLGVGLPVVVLLLVAGAVFCTVYFRGINLRGLPLAYRVLRGDFDRPNAPGEVTHFQALATAISGTVGIGNIGGVAVAISVGGPGATLWMIAAGFLGMATKFAECTLGVRYRKVHADGTVSGGPMFTLRHGLREHGREGLGRFLGGFYAVGIVIGCLGIGNMYQANQAFVQLTAVTGGADSALQGRGWLVGLVLAVVVGAVIIGGIRSIAVVTHKLVPFMAVLYVGGALIVIAFHLSALPAAIGAILSGAFTAQGVTGGALGALVVGMKRAVFSNEAGLGSASIAHAAVRTDVPATEGVVALLEPFVDTVVICTISALVIGVSIQDYPGFLEGGLEGVALTSDAFGRTVSWFPIPLALAALLFAVSTMISWAYYGLQGWTYLFGPSAKLQNIYKIIFCSFVAVGAAIRLDAVLDFSDAMVFVLCVPNLCGLVLLTPVVRAELARLRTLDAQSGVQAR